MGQRERFGRWLRETRKAKNQSQMQVAVEIGVEQITVSRWESGGIPASHLIPLVAKWADTTLEHIHKLIAAEKEARA